MKTVEWRDNGLWDVGILRTIYWLYLIGGLLGIAKAAFIPRDAVLTKINSSESEYLSSICGLSTEHSNDTTGRRYPWAVSIMFQGKNRLGGTIISPYHILTAAHAFVRFDNSLPGIGSPCLVHGYRRFSTIHSREVALGDDCIKYEQRTVYLDDGFADGGCLKGHDWAIIEVAVKMDLNSSSIRPICLPQVEDKRELPSDSRVMVVGWGRPNVFGASDPLIRQIPMLHNAECKAPWSDYMPSHNADYLCARALDPNNDDSARTCHGDSGSGLEERNFYSNQGRATLLGITSFGSRGCPANELARFTKVANYLEKICELTGVCYSQSGRTNVAI